MGTAATFEDTRPGGMEVEGWDRFRYLCMGDVDHQFVVEVSEAPGAAAAGRRRGKD
jgi:hypothetical protein